MSKEDSVAAQHGRDIALLKQFVYRAAGYGPGKETPENYDFKDAIHDATRRLEKVEQNEERMDQVEHGFAQLVTDLPTQKRSKREKLAAVVKHALENGRQGTEGVTITKDAAAGAAGCSGRWALELFKDLEDAFEWCERDLQGEQAKLKIRKGGRSKAEILDVLTNEFAEGSQE